MRSVESSVLAGAAAMLQLRLLEVYLALPSAAAFTKEHEALVKLCSRSLHGSTLVHRPGEALMLHPAPKMLHISILRYFESYALY